MMITDELFDAYLRCKTKAYLTFSDTGMSHPSHPVSDWVRHLAEEYQAACRESLRSADGGDCLVGSPCLDDLKHAKYRLIIEPYIGSHDVGSNIHALQQGPTRTDKRHSPYAPIRFVPF